MTKKKLVSLNGQLAILTTKPVWKKSQTGTREPNDGELVPHYHMVIRVEILVRGKGKYKITEVDIEHLRAILDAESELSRTEELLPYCSLHF